MVDPILSKVYNQEMSSSAPIKLAAVIVESRSRRDLYEVIANHLNNLPVGTDLVWFTSQEAAQERSAGIMTLFGADRQVHVHIRKIDSLSDYNKLLTSPEFWALLCDWQKVLIFQCDGYALRSGIEEHYGVDYIGAEWAFNRYHPGNGGESLRSPSVMLEVCRQFPWDGATNEDIWITEHMFKHKIGKLATIEQARRFSVEAVYTLGSMFEHACSKWLTPEQCAAIRTQYQTHTIS